MVPIARVSGGKLRGGIETPCPGGERDSRNCHQWHPPSRWPGSATRGTPVNSRVAGGRSKFQNTGGGWGFSLSLDERDRGQLATDVWARGDTGPTCRTVNLGGARWVRKSGPGNGRRGVGRGPCCCLDPCGLQSEGTARAHGHCSNRPDLVDRVSLRGGSGCGGWVGLRRNGCMCGWEARVVRALCCCCGSTALAGRSNCLMKFCLFRWLRRSYFFDRWGELGGTSRKGSEKPGSMAGRLVVATVWSCGKKQSDVL